MYAHTGDHSQHIQVVKAKNKKRGTLLKLVRCGRSEDNKGRGQEVEGNEEITEILLD